MAYTSMYSGDNAFYTDDDMEKGGHINEFAEQTIRQGFIRKVFGEFAVVGDRASLCHSPSTLQSSVWPCHALLSLPLPPAPLTPPLTLP